MFFWGEGGWKKMNMMHWNAMCYWHRIYWTCCLKRANLWRCIHYVDRYLDICLFKHQPEHFTQISQNTGYVSHSWISWTWPVCLMNSAYIHQLAFFHHIHVPTGRGVKFKMSSKLGNKQWICLFWVEDFISVLSPEYLPKFNCSFIQ